MNVLVDTAVWSLMLRRPRARLSADEGAIVDQLRMLANSSCARMVGPVRQQLLSGIRDGNQYTKLRTTLRGLTDEPLETFDYELAAEIANRCVKGGIAVSDIDLLLCAIAVRRNWPIFTTDKDFARYQKFCPLKLHKA